MWALITGGFVFGMAVIFSLGKASSKREQATYNHREELLARSSKDNSPESDITVTTHNESVDQKKTNKGNTARHPSEQV